VFHPLSTGITFALTEKAPIDKIPLVSVGYGRSESADGGVFKWNFPLAGVHWASADIYVQYIAKKEGGFDKLKGKKLTLLYLDSPFWKGTNSGIAGARQDVTVFDLNNDYRSPLRV